MGQIFDPRTYPIRIVDESDEWIVVEKPPFIEAHPSRPNARVTLWDELRGILAFEIVNGGQVSIINRLDRETSGLTLIAKTRSMARSLSFEMAERRVQKEYLAVTWGWPAEDEFSSDAPLLRQGERQLSQIYLKQMVHPDGATASTAFRVERRFTRPDPGGGRFSVIRAFPRTGRTHQIRVHLAHVGFPVVGDKIYGPDERCFLEFIQTDWTPSLASRLLLPRHALHSTVLSLPALGLSWTAPLFADLASWVANAPTEQTPP